MSLVGLAEQPWRHIAGPASAVVATLKRIGWSAPGPDHFCDRGGRVFDLKTVHPFEVARRIDIATQEWLWSEVSSKYEVLMGMESICWIEPLMDVLNGADKAVAAMAKYVLIGANWTQQRLYDLRLAGTNIWHACVVAPGTFRHRINFCPLLIPKGTVCPCARRKGGMMMPF